jgi:hypothetical protein
MQVVFKPLHARTVIPSTPLKPVDGLPKIGILVESHYVDQVRACGRHTRQPARLR